MSLEFISWMLGLTSIIFLLLVLVSAIRVVMWLLDKVPHVELHVPITIRNSAQPLASSLNRLRLQIVHVIQRGSVSESVLIAHRLKTIVVRRRDELGTVKRNRRHSVHAHDRDCCEYHAKTGHRHPECIKGTGEG